MGKANSAKRFISPANGSRPQVALLAWAPTILLWFAFLATYYEHMSAGNAARAAFVIVCTSAVLSVPTWFRTLRLPWPPRVGWDFASKHVMAAAAYAAVFVLAVYAFWPTRHVSIWRAMQLSGQVPLVLLTGFILYGMTSGLSYAIQMRRKLDATESAASENQASAAAALQTLRVRLEQLTDNQRRPAGQLFLRDGNRTLPVHVAAVERLEACDDYVAVYVDGKRYLVSERLKDLIARLDPKRFVRVHRSHVINLTAVAAFEEYDRTRWQVIMRSGARVAASRPGTRTLRELIQRNGT